jgi:hypothetical protein
MIELKLISHGIHCIEKKDLKSATFRWKLDNFSKLTHKVESEIFELNECKWYLRMYPMGEKEIGQHITLYLIYAGPEKSCSARFVLRLKNQRNPVLSYSFDGGRDVFKAANGWGKSEYFALSKLNEDFLFDDSIVIETEIKIE